jgi:hypothetical protein
MNSLQVQKSPALYSRQNSGNSCDISKGFLHSGMWKFDPSEVSHPLLRSARLPKRRENGPEIRAFANSSSSLNAGSAEVKADIAESLRPSPQIFPFWRDYGRSLVRSRLPPGMVIDSPKGVSCGVTLNSVKTAVKGRKKQLLTPDVQSIKASSEVKARLLLALS